MDLDKNNQEIIVNWTLAYNINPNQVTYITRELIKDDMAIKKFVPDYSIMVACDKPFHLLQID
jgi:hypothetical protein